MITRLQALLQVPTVVSARQGPSGPDQVRVQRFLVLFSTRYMFDRPRTESSDLVCRLDYRSQLQPERGRDLRDRIRSGCFDCIFEFPFEMASRCDNFQNNEPVKN